MIIRISQILCLILALLFIGCSDRVAGGGPSGSEAGNAITANLILNDGTPATSALLRIRSNTYVPGDTGFKLDTLIQSNNGVYNVHGIPRGQFVLEVLSSHQALLQAIAFDTVGKDLDLGSQNLDAPVQVRGRVPKELATQMRIVIPGLERQGVPDSSGSFILDSLPSGQYTLQTYHNNFLAKAFLHTEPGDTVDLGLLHEEGNSIWLEDFEDGDDHHRFAALTEGGSWYLAKSPNVDIDDRFAGLSVPLEQALSCGRCLQFSARFESTSSWNPWLETGLNLGGPNQYYDFSNVDSIAFKIRGSGSLYFKLLVKDTLNTSSEFNTLIVLDSNWTRLAIAVNDLEYVRFDSSPYPMDAPLAKQRIRALSFYTLSDMELWLDELELIGENLSLF